MRECFERSILLSLEKLRLKMKFYRLDSPNYKSARKKEQVNGYLKHPYGLPGIKCSGCGKTWGSSDILALECPESLRKRKEINNHWPVSSDIHRNLRNELLSYPDFSELPERALLPGVSFQPCQLNIVSYPIVDFLWASLGNLVVSERIFDVFCRDCPDDFVASQVLIDSQVGEGNLYYEIIPKKYSDYPSWRRPKSICNVCFREDVKVVDGKVQMEEGMWQGGDLFFLRTTLYIFITEKLYDSIKALKPTNLKVTATIA